MILDEILARAVSDDEPILAEFVRTVAGPFIANHALTAAKGSTHHYFGKNPDQSMVAHIFNGIFPTMRLLALVRRVLGEEYLSPLGQRLYLLGYAMHDLNKIRGMMEDIATGSQAEVATARTLLAEELARVNAAAFLPNYQDYLEDILYIVVNTQLVSGANYSSYQFNLRHDERELRRARDLSSYSDCLSFLVKNPADIRYGEVAERCGQILGLVSRDRFAFAYHQISDVRGLLTNVINNAVKTMLAAAPDDAAAVGPIVPYLYFTNGIVYIKTERKAVVDTSESHVWAAVEQGLRDQCSSRVNENTPGFKFDTKSNLGCPIYFKDLVTAERLAELMITVSLRTGMNVTESTYNSMQARVRSGQIPPTVNFDFYRQDIKSGRIAQAGRFLLNFDKLIIKPITDANVCQQLTDLLKQRFGFSDEVWTQAMLIPSEGGLDYRYFWLGAQFIETHRYLSDEGEDERSLAGFLQSFVDDAAPLFAPAMPSGGAGVLAQLRRYIAANLSFAGFGTADSPPPHDFAAEFGKYVAAKQPRGASMPCTVCNSPYLLPNYKQKETDVLFQPWIYKNRLPLNSTANAGGLCAICLLEMMLRMLMQKGGSRQTGKDFEEISIKFLYLYPSYFFTTETGKLMQTIIDKMGDFSIFALRKEIGSQPLHPATYIGLKMFDVEDYTEENKKPRYTYYTMDYSGNDVQGLIFFGQKTLQPKGKDSNRPTAAETWAVPAILALMLPLVLGCKVIASDSYLPLFASGEDFKETVILDAPHHFLNYLLSSDPADISGIPVRQLRRDQLRVSPAGRIRIDQLLPKLRLITRAYLVNVDTNADGRDAKFNMVSRIARGLRSDPLNLFHYLKEQARNDQGAVPLSNISNTPKYVEQYYPDLWQGLQQAIGGNDPMEIISGLVERYATFYGGDLGSSSSITRPLDIACRLLLDHPREAVQSEAEFAADLKLMMQGELMKWLDRVRNQEGSGRARFYGKDISEKEAPALQDFVNFLYDQVFHDYCRGEASLLRSRLNNLKSGCEAYYVTNWKKWSKKYGSAADDSVTVSPATAA